MVLVNMDSNESIEENKDLKAFQEASHLVDLIATFSPSQVNLPTYLRGKKRIDHSFCTHNLLPFVISATICQSLSLSDSDHRAIEVTLDRQKLMKKTKASHRPPQRKLSQKNPASVRRYQELVTKYFDDHKLLERIQMVKTLLEEEPELDLDLKEEMLNQLDAEKTRLMLAAEKRCSKTKRFGIYHLSPILAAAGKSYSAAKKAVKKLLRAQDSTGIAIACAKDEVKVCRGNLKDAQKEAAENRSRHLEERAELLKELRNTEAEHIVEEIKKVEEAVEMARKLRPYNNTQRSGPLDHVLLPQDDGTWRKVESPLAVESAILKQNQQDLEYANACPFLQPPLFSQLGPLGDQMGADNLLQGIVDVDTSAYSNQRELDALLVRLKKVTETNVSEDLSEWEYRKLYRKTRESTASSLSGLHYGHYKAIVETKLGSAVLHQLTTLPFEYGLSLQRWQQSVHFMLQKKGSSLHSQVTDHSNVQSRF